MNTAEDIPEDRSSKIHTSALALGVRGSVIAATTMVGIGGGAVLGLLGWMLADHKDPVVLSLAPLLVAWGFVLAGLAKARRKVEDSLHRARDDERRVIDALRPYARRVPIWISLTAFGTLVAVGALRC